VEPLRGLVSRGGAVIPNNLVVFIAAIFLSYAVNAFTTIYAVPGHPARSFGLWGSFVSSVIAAGLWTALAAKQDVIDKAILSSGGDLDAREAAQTRMWREVWLRTLIYLGGGVVFSVAAMLVLVFP
jgi:hypothetical protein